MDNSRELSRRRFIALASGLTLPVLVAGCRNDAKGDPPDAAGDRTAADAAVDAAVASVSVALSDYPALAEDKGYATIAATGDMADVLLVRDGDSVHAFINVCTHQACALEPDGEAGLIRCDRNCGHGSIYAMDGRVIQGPSLSDLYEYESELDAGGDHVTIRPVLKES
ncbi:MAG: Rieske 2Fe-2S domain-containing protein [Candidatus Poribacteria bacterium]